ncbi:MAG TPA: hypothetical protein VKD43_06205 [Xanthobacteraceae bacterium]|nr:hypothetical protein [Xanthobacteraceae bacterium]
MVRPGGGGNWQGGNWHGNRHHRGHFRGPVFGFAAPYYDYASPYYYDDSCYELRYIRGAYRRVYVCEEY